MLFSGSTIEWLQFFDKTIGGMTYWFTSALVVAELLIWLLLKSKIKSMGPYFATCLALTCVAIFGIQHNWFSIENYWRYKQGLLCLAFMGLGGLYWRYEQMFNKWLNVWTLFVLTVLYLYFAPWRSILVTTSMCHVNYFGLVEAFIGCLLLIQLCKVLPMNRFIRFVGDNSIGFYFLCGVMPIGFSAVFHRVLPTNYWLVIPVWMVSVAAAFPVVWFIKRYLPFLFDFSLLLKNR